MQCASRASSKEGGALLEFILMLMITGGETLWSGIESLKTIVTAREKKRDGHTRTHARTREHTQTERKEQGMKITSLHTCTSAHLDILTTIDQHQEPPYIKR